MIFSLVTTTSLTKSECISCGQNSFCNIIVSLQIIPQWTENSLCTSTQMTTTRIETLLKAQHTLMLTAHTTVVNICTSCELLFNSLA